MTTRQERADASAQKRQADLNKAAHFSKELLLPIILCIETGDKVTPMRVSKREIRDKFGREAVRCFSRIFKCRQRGGRALNGDSYKSMWVLNYAAAQTLKDWCLASETLDELEARLIAAGADEEEWDKEASSFVVTAIRKLILKGRRKSRAIYRKSIEACPKRDENELARYEALM